MPGSLLPNTLLLRALHVPSIFDIPCSPFAIHSFTESNSQMIITYNSALNPTLENKTGGRSPPFSLNNYRSYTFQIRLVGAVAGYHIRTRIIVQAGLLNIGHTERI